MDNTVITLTTEFVGREESEKVLAEVESTISNLEKVRDSIKYGILLKHSEIAVGNLAEQIEKKIQHLDNPE